MKSNFPQLLMCSAAAMLILAACQAESTNETLIVKETVQENDGGIVKSRLDKREYAYRQLPNGLNVMVVSDPDADKAAASLDVHIGHLADPADREGLTHFLEHMLFLGTGKYPEVGEYQKFISKHGGSNNAGTGMEHTSYYFQIDNDYLEPALDRFSRFFIDPLFDPEYLDKERNAIESEYSLKTKDDARRYNEAERQTANQAHPMTQFSVGNLTTLSDSGASTILEAVKAHYEKYYSADIMSLSVVGNYSTDELMAWAGEKFSDVPSKGETRPLDRPEPYLDGQTGVKIMINTLEDKRTLRLTFALPSSEAHYREKPIAYISGILGHEGKGTLYDVLKSKNYLKNMYVTTYGPDDFTRFGLHFDLTNEGYEHIDEITDYFFSYVEKLRRSGVTQSSYDELARIANLNFEYQHKFRISSFAGMLSHGMQHFPARHALEIGRMYENFDPALIDSYLNYIRPENMRMIISTPDFDGPQKESRYDVAYAMEAIDPAKLAGWAGYSRMDEISMPSPNPYIAEDLEAKNTAIITSPALAFEKPGLTLWYMNENEFDLPKSSLNFRIYPAKAYDSTSHKMAMSLHSRIVRDLLDNESYPASRAGLYYGINSIGRAYDVGVQGYNDKIDVYLGKVIEAFDPEAVSEDVFDRMKKNLQQEIANRAFARPINQAFMAFNIELNKDGLTDPEQQAALETLDYETFKSLVADILSSIQIEGTYVGNVSKTDARDMGKMLQKAFKGRLNEDAKLPVVQPNVSESGKTYIRQFNVDHNDSTLVWAFKGDDDTIESRAKSKLIQQILRPRFYKSLRTDQQFGYQVSMFSTERDRMPYTGFFIQSPKAHPSILMDKFDEFMQAQTEYLKAMSDEEFQGHMDGLLSNVNKKYDNIYAKGNSLHSNLIEGNLDFDNRADLTAAIKALTKADIVDYYQSELLGDKRRSFAVWNIGKAHVDEASYDPSGFELCKEKHCILNRFE